MTYLITFVCYGSHLHGDTGTVDRHHNLPGSRLLPANPRWVSINLQRMLQPPYLLDAARRDIVIAALRHRCDQHAWTLLAAHARSNHVHLVVESNTQPERIMNDLKSFASRCLNQTEREAPGRKRWAKHGSTRWLRNQSSVSAAIRYVVDAQGARRAVYESPS